MTQLYMVSCTDATNFPKNFSGSDPRHRDLSAKLFHRHAERLSPKLVHAHAERALLLTLAKSLHADGVLTASRQKEDEEAEDATHEGFSLDELVVLEELYALLPLEGRGFRKLAGTSLSQKDEAQELIS
jgi:hypothetical protein